jgi:glycosyltransferase involved in cell wall biosynthesis
MRHALFVAFHYPPEASSSGVLRTLKYTQYLGEYGWRVTVITVNEDAYAVVDPALKVQIPQSVRVLRTRYINVKRHLSIAGRYPAVAAVPDVWSGWLPWGVRTGRRVLREDPVDVVYSTSPHATAHMIAGRLARIGRVPWVVDFRDPWYETPPEPDTPWITHWFAKRLEARVVAQATRVVATTDQLCNELRQRYQQMAGGKFRTIMNGYDEADFSMLDSVVAAKKERLVIVHTGGLNAAFRDPRPVIRAIAQAARDGRVDVARIILRLIGGGPFADSKEVADCIEKEGLGSSVQVLPRLGYDQALQQLAEADVALLLQASPDTASLIPAKLFEYLRAGKPVLAIVGRGASRELVESLGAGWTVDPRMESELSNAVVDMYGLWASGRLGDATASEADFVRFERRNLTAELAAIFDEISAGAPL